jgi:hypothetical protein
LVFFPRFATDFFAGFFAFFTNAFLGFFFKVFFVFFAIWPFLLNFFAHFTEPFFEGIRIYTVLCALYYDFARDAWPFPPLSKVPAVHALLRRVPACALGDAALIRMSDQAGIASANYFGERREGLIAS